MRLLSVLFPPSTARYVEERPFGNDKKVSQTRDGQVRIEATVPNTQELLTELHDLSWDIKVLGAKVLSDYFQDLSRKLYEQYCD